jgi:excisionase family DNA binding protein
MQMREGDGVQRDGRRGTFLGANDIARICDVDLKTIHNWVDRGVLPHFRTPGRHLRFRPEHVAAFLRAWGYAVPASLRDAASKHVAVIGPKKLERLVKQALEDAPFDVRALEHAYDGLLTVATEPAYAYVIDVDVVGRGVVAQYTSAMRRAAPDAVLVVVGAADGGVADDVISARCDVAELRAALPRTTTGASADVPAARLRAGAALE